MWKRSIDEIESRLNEDLDNIRMWLQARRLLLNVAEIEYFYKAYWLKSKIGNFKAFL